MFNGLYHFPKIVGAIRESPLQQIDLGAENTIAAQRDRDRYQLCYVGWDDQQRILSVLLYFEIKNGKIWVQYNGTETAIAQVLTERGVPASDIVLGFHSPFKRQFSGYAVN